LPSDLLKLWSLLVAGGGLWWQACALLVPWLALHHVGAAAGHDLHEALSGEHPDGLAGGQPGHPYRCMSWVSDGTGRPGDMSPLSIASRRPQWQCIHDTITRLGPHSCPRSHAAG
jgi:hypothetical protein